MHDMLLDLSGMYVKSAQILASKGDFMAGMAYMVFTVSRTSWLLRIAFHGRWWSSAGRTGMSGRGRQCTTCCWTSRACT